MDLIQIVDIIKFELILYFIILNIVYFSLDSYRYEGETFTCDDNKKSIPISWVNDNYCDCLDGTDEPGTAACKSGKFYCRNEKFHPTLIPSQWVNDGICGMFRFDFDFIFFFSFSNVSILK